MLIDNRMRTPKANRRHKQGRRAGLKWRDEQAIEALVASKADRIAKVISQQQIEDSIQPISGEDIVGDTIKQNKTMTVTSCNTNNGALYTTTDSITKGAAAT